MTAARLNRFDLRWIAAPLMTVFLLMIAHAAFAFQGDGRINMDGYMGGDSVYCVDANHNPTGEPIGAGLKLLNAQGVELFYVSPEQITAVPRFPTENTLITQGTGSYGPIYLERLTSGEFQLIGTEDHGKTFFFTWTDCTQITPIPTSHSNGSGPSYLSQVIAICLDHYDIDPSDAVGVSQCTFGAKSSIAECKHDGDTPAECVSHRFL